ATRKPPTAAPAIVPSRESVWLSAESAARSSGATSCRGMVPAAGSKNASHRPKATLAIRSRATVGGAARHHTATESSTTTRSALKSTITLRASERSAYAPPTSSTTARGTVPAATTNPATAGDAICTAVHAKAIVKIASPASESAFAISPTCTSRSRRNGGGVRSIRVSLVVISHLRRKAVCEEVHRHALLPVLAVDPSAPFVEHRV